MLYALACRVLHAYCASAITADASIDATRCVPPEFRAALDGSRLATLSLSARALCSTMHVDRDDLVACSSRMFRAAEAASWPAVKAQPCVFQLSPSFIA